MTHLRTKHQIVRPGTSNSNLQQNLLVPRQINQNRLREMIAEWSVDRRHAFIEVESQTFRNLVEYLNPLAVNLVPKSGNTCRADIMKCFDVAKLYIQDSLSAARSKIHLSFDLWSSPNYKSIIAVVGHWTNSDFKVETATLVMKEIFGEHKGEYLAPVIYEIAKQFGIENNLGWFVIDNATNNDTTLRYLNGPIRDDGGDGFNVEERHLCCLGHVLNLAVKLLLFNGNVSTVSKELREVIEEVQEDSPNRRESRIKEWRARGVVGRIHNIIVYIRGSNQRRNAFLLASGRCYKEGEGLHG
jgi:hypothetical protein